MDFPKFVDLLERRALHFAKASKVLDPYEGTVPAYNEKVRSSVYQELRQQYDNDESFNTALKKISESLHGALPKLKETILISSWHENEYQSAAMWDIYGKRNAGIAIQSTYIRFAQSLAKNTADKVWIGMVKYIDPDKEWGDEWNLFEFFMRKRKSFEYERELRGITALPEIGFERVLSETDKKREKESPSKKRIIDPSELTEYGKYVSVDLDSLIEKIYVAPKSPSYLSNSVIAIAEKYGYNRDLVTDSDLYTLK